jgi:hypothetical protein
MIGQVIGALTTTANRRSVIFKADGSEDRLALDCTSADAASARASAVSTSAAVVAEAAAAPID